MLLAPLELSNWPNASGKQKAEFTSTRVGMKNRVERGEDDRTVHSFGSINLFLELR